MKNFSGKNVVITGGASGIGLALANAFVAEGAHLAISDISQKGLDETANKFKQQGVTIRCYQVDHSSREENESFASKILEDMGHVDVVCANAGVAQSGPFEQASMDDWKWEFDINYWGVVYTLRNLVPSMIERGKGGSVLITSSGSGLMPSPGMSGYHANKAAVSILGQSLHTELESYGIGVSVLCPGQTKTGIAKSGRLSMDDPELAKKAIKSAEKLYAKAADPAQIAADALKGLRRNKMVIATPKSAVLPGWLIYRLSPTLFHKLVLRPLWRKGKTVAGATLLADRAKKG